MSRESHVPGIPRAALPLPLGNELAAPELAGHHTQVMRLRRAVPVTQPGRNVLLGPRGEELALASPLHMRVHPGKATLLSFCFHPRPATKESGRGGVSSGKGPQGLGSAGPPLRPASPGFLQELLVEPSQQHLGSGRETWKFWVDFAKGHLGFRPVNFR